MKRRSCGGRFAILCSMNALAPAAPVARQSLVRRPSLFWILHGAGWLGYFAFNYLIALAHGKPGGYLAVVAASAHAGNEFSWGGRGGQICGFNHGAGT